MRRAPLLLAAALGCGGPPAPAPDPPPAPAAADRPVPFFPTAVGTTWVYDTGRGIETTHTVSSASARDGATVVTVVSKGAVTFAEEVYAVSPSEVTRLEMQYRAISPPLCLVKLPPRAGDTWAYAVESRRKGEDGPAERTTGTRTVAGVERVEVPAGVFTAVRVVSESVSGADRQKSTFWYAPGVGEVKMDPDDPRYDGRRLKSFTPGKG